MLMCWPCCYLSAHGAQQEATKFKTAMADPEFQSMLRDYMEEMQDPAHRAVSGERLIPCSTTRNMGYCRVPADPCSTTSRGVHIVYIFRGTGSSVMSRSCIRFLPLMSCIAKKQDLLLVSSRTPPPPILSCPRHDDVGRGCSAGTRALHLSAGGSKRCPRGQRGGAPSAGLRDQDQVREGLKGCRPRKGDSRHPRLHKPRNTLYHA